MIRDTLSRRRNPSITSDRWHVVHAHSAGGTTEGDSFARTIVSEHDDREAAVLAARELVRSLARELAARPPSQRDQVFVRPPTFKSLKTAGFVKRRRK